MPLITLKDKERLDKCQGLDQDKWGKEKCTKCKKYSTCPTRRKIIRRYK